MNELGKKILAVLENEGALNMQCYTTPTNWISNAIIVSATSSRHMLTLVDKLSVLKADYDVFSEGNLDWMIVSAFNDTTEYVVHIFTPEVREYYTLDDLWAKSKR